MPAAWSTIQSSDARVGGLVSKPSFFTLGLLDVRLSMDQSHPERGNYLSPQSVGKSNSGKLDRVSTFRGKRLDWQAFASLRRI